MCVFLLINDDACVLILCVTGSGTTDRCVVMCDVYVLVLRENNVSPFISFA